MDLKQQLKTAMNTDVRDAQNRFDAELELGILL